MNKKCKKLLIAWLSLIVLFTCLQNSVLVSHVEATDSSDELKITRIHKKHKELLDKLRTFKKDNTGDKSLPLVSAREINRIIKTYNSNIESYIEEYNDKVSSLFADSDQKAEARKELDCKIDTLITYIKSCKNKVQSINNRSGFKIFEITTEIKALENSNDSHNIYRDNSYRKKVPFRLEAFIEDHEFALFKYPTNAGKAVLESVEEKYKNKLDDLYSLRRDRTSAINVMIGEGKDKGRLLRLKEKLLDKSAEIDTINKTEYMFSDKQFIDTSSINLQLETKDIDNLFEGVEKFFDCYYDFSLDYNNLRYPTSRNDYCNEIDIGLLDKIIEREINNVQIPYVVPGDLDTKKQDDIDFLNAMSIDPDTYSAKKSTIRMGGHFPREYIKLQLEGSIEKINKFKIKHKDLDDESSSIANIDDFYKLYGITISQYRIESAIGKAEKEKTSYIILDREAILAEYNLKKRAQPVEVDFIIEVEYEDGKHKNYKKTITLLPAYDEGWDIYGEDRMFIKNTLLECEDGPKQNITEDSFIGISELTDAKPEKGGFLAAIDNDYNNSKTKMIRLAGQIINEPEESGTWFGSKEYKFSLRFDDGKEEAVTMQYKKKDNNCIVSEYPKVQIDGKDYELKYYARSSKEELNLSAKQYFKDLRLENEKIGYFLCMNEKDKDAKLIHNIFEDFNIEIPDNLYALSSYKGLDYRNFKDFTYGDSGDEEKDLYVHAYRLFLNSYKNKDYMSIEEQNEYTLNGIFNFYNVGINPMTNSYINDSTVKSEVLKLNNSDIGYYYDTRYRSLVGACAPLQIKKLKMKGNSSSDKYFVPSPGDVIWFDVPDSVKSDRIKGENPYILMFKDYMPDKAAIYAGYECENTSGRSTVWHYLLTSDSYISSVSNLEQLDDCSIKTLKNGLVTIKMADKLYWQLLSSAARTRLSFSQYPQIKIGDDNSTYIPFKNNPDYYKSDSTDPMWKNFRNEYHDVEKDISIEGVYFINADEKNYLIDASVNNPYKDRKTLTLLLSNTSIKACKLKLYKDSKEIAVSKSTKDGECISRILLERDGKYILKIAGENKKLESGDLYCNVNGLLHVMYDNREVFVNNEVKATWIQNSIKDKYFAKDGIVRSALYFNKSEADILLKLRNENKLRKFREKCEFVIYEKRYKITPEALEYIGVSRWQASKHPFCGLWLEELMLALPDNAHLLLNLNENETGLLKKISNDKTLNMFKDKCYKERPEVYPYGVRYKITREALEAVGAKGYPFCDKWLHEIPDLNAYYKNLRKVPRIGSNGVRVIRYADNSTASEVIKWEPWENRIPKESPGSKDHYCIMDETGFGGEIYNVWNFNSIKLQEYIPEDRCDIDKIWETIVDIKELWCFPLLESWDTNHPPLGSDNYFGCNRDKGARKHAGIDFHGKPGQKVVAMYEGKILRVSDDFYKGLNSVSIAHPVSATENYIVRYGEIRLDPSIKEGDTVSKGQLLGVMETMYFEKSPPAQMLHIEVYNDGHRSDLKIDPLSKKPKGEYKYLDNEMKNWYFKRRDDLMNPSFILDLKIN